jgi:hypothetical protein
MDDTPAPRGRKSALRPLKIDLDELAFAMESASLEATYFLELETGRLILLTQDANAEYEALCESIGPVDEAGWAEAFEAALLESDAPDWEHDMLRDADRVAAGLPTQYQRVPEADGRESWQDMEDFIATVANPRVAERLSDAIHGKGAFRRFKDTLLDHPAERERWFAFQKALQIERAREWLESIGVQPQA